MYMYIYIYICACVCVCACLCVCQVTHIFIYIYMYIYIYMDINKYIYIYTCIYVYKNQCTCPSMQGMCLCLVYHVCNTILTYCWLPSVFFSRWFAHRLVKPIGNSTKWTQSAVKRKAFEHGAKSMVTESAIRVIEIARCLFSKQTKTAGPQWTTLPCFCICWFHFSSCFCFFILCWLGAPKNYPLPLLQNMFFFLFGYVWKWGDLFSLQRNHFGVKKGHFMLRHTHLLILFWTCVFVASMLCWFAPSKTYPTEIYRFTLAQKASL